MSADEQVAVRPVHSRRQSFFGDVATLASGTTVAQLIAVASAPVLTRLFAPATFGTFELFIAVSSLVLVFATLRFDFAVVLPADDHEAAGLLVLSLWALVAVVGATSVAAALVPESVAAHRLGDDWRQVILLIPLFVGAEGLLRVCRKWTNRQRAYRLHAASTIVATITGFGLRIGFALGGWATTGALVVGGVAGSAVAAIVVASRIIGDVARHATGHVRPQRLLELARRYRKFPLYTGWAAWIYTAAISLPAVMMFGGFSPAVAGFYAVGERVFLQPLNVIGQATAQVFFQRASQAHRDGTLAELVGTVHRTLTLVATFPVLLVAAFGKPLFTLVLGHDWAEAGVYAQILSVQVFFHFLATPMGRLFYVLERQEANAVFSTTLFGVRAAALAGGIALGNVYTTLALLSVGSSIVFAGFSFWIARVAKVPARQWLAALTSSWVRAATVLAPGALWMAKTDPGPWSATAAAAATSVVYAGWLWKREPALRDLLRQLRGNRY